MSKEPSVETKCQRMGDGMKNSSGGTTCNLYTPFLSDGTNCNVYQNMWSKKRRKTNK